MSESLVAPEEVAKTPSVAERLSEPFSMKVIGFKPGVVSGSRAIPFAHIDARDVMDRLDEVVGPGNWEDEYVILSDDAVMCRLSVRLGPGGMMVTKSDVGTAETARNKNPDRPGMQEGMKALFSDALKRTAIKFGIGRYLYRLELSWCDYDPKKGGFNPPPQLPDWALPENERRSSSRPAGAAAPRVATVATPPPGKAETRPAPKNGIELLKRLTEFQNKMVAAGKCKDGDVIDYIARQASKKEFPNKMDDWTAQQVAEATDWVEAFKAKHK